VFTPGADPHPKSAPPQLDLPCWLAHLPAGVCQGGVWGGSGRVLGVVVVGGLCLSAFGAGGGATRSFARPPALLFGVVLHVSRETLPGTSVLFRGGDRGGVGKKRTAKPQSAFAFSTGANSCERLTSPPPVSYSNSEL
jgi:hypothetical protein